MVDRPVVVISGGRIQTVSEGGTSAVPDAKLIELGDATLLPGYRRAYGTNVAHRCEPRHQSEACICCVNESGSRCGDAVAFVAASTRVHRQVRRVRRRCPAGCHRCRGCDRAPLIALSVSTSTKTNAILDMAGFTDVRFAVALNFGETISHMVVNGRLQRHREMQDSTSAPSIGSWPGRIAALPPLWMPRAPSLRYHVQGPPPGLLATNMGSGLPEVLILRRMEE